jgi:methylenetetrahydrofolate reductase (NADPH)
MAQQAGLELTLLTQFFFDQAPFLDWVRELRSGGVQARLVGGLAGPTRLSTLIKFAMRCGAGASMRVLTARPQAFTKLLGDHGPESVLRGLAQARCEKSSDFAGVHLFSLAALFGPVDGCRRSLTGASYWMTPTALGFRVRQSASHAALPRIDK